MRRDTLPPSTSYSLHEVCFFSAQTRLAARTVRARTAPGRGSSLPRRLSRSFSRDRCFGFRGGCREKLFFQVALQHRFAGVAPNRIAASVAQTHKLLPIRGLRIPAAFGIDGRRKRNRDVAGTRKNCAVAEKIARTGERNRDQRRAGIHRGLERTKLKRTNTGFWNERALGKDKNGIAGAKRVFDRFRGLPA